MHYEQDWTAKICFGEAGRVRQELGILPKECGPKYIPCPECVTQGNQTLPVVMQNIHLAKVGMVEMGETMALAFMHGLQSGEVIECRDGGEVACSKYSIM